MKSSVKKQTSLTKVGKITERAQSLALLDAGLTMKDMAKQLCKSERWITTWRQRRDENQQLADQSRSGRPSKIVGIVKRKVEKIKYKKGKSTRKCSKELKSTGFVSLVTVYNYLRKVKKWKAFKKPRNQLLLRKCRGSEDCNLLANTSIRQLKTGRSTSSVMSLQNICSVSQTDKTMLCGGLSQTRHQTSAV